MSQLEIIDERARKIFQQLVENYLQTGEPVGSRTLSHESEIGASAATVRNVMADLTDMGLLHAPHISAGRLPTEIGLRLFVDSLLQVGDLSEEDRENIDDRFHDQSIGGNPMDTMLEEAASRLTGLTGIASLVITNKTEAPLRHIEFVSNSPGQALAILVFEDGSVENRAITLPTGLPPSSLIAASNYLNARLRGLSLSQARTKILTELEQNRAELDDLTATLVENGVAELSGTSSGKTDQNDNNTAARTMSSSLIVRGRGRLLDETSEQDLERVRMLFDDLERKQEVIDLLGAAHEGEGVKIFIGSENRLFSLSGSSVIVAPYKDSNKNIVGVLGVIGPTRLNYARLIPIVDYTAEVVSRLLK